MNAGLLGALVLILIAALHVIECAIWPYTSCPKCSGGRRYAPSGRAFRDCPRCKGSGRRLRMGRRIYNYFRRDR